MFFFVTMLLMRSIHWLRRRLIFIGVSGWPPLVGSHLPTMFFSSTKLEPKNLLKESKFRPFEL